MNVSDMGFSFLLRVQEESAFETGSHFGAFLNFYRSILRNFDLSVFLNDAFASFHVQVSPGLIVKAFTAFVTSISLFFHMNRGHVLSKTPRLFKRAPALLARAVFAFVMRHALIPRGKMYIA